MNISEPLNRFVPEPFGNPEDPSGMAMIAAAVEQVPMSHLLLLGDAGKKSRAEAARGPRAEGAHAAGCRRPAGPSHGSSEPALCGDWKRSLRSKASAMMVRRVQRSRISWRPGGRAFLRHGQTPRIAVLRTCGPGFSKGPIP